MTPKSVLAVDDNVDVLSLLALMLTRHGHRVRKATSGEQALLELTSARFDLVFLDIMMPGLNGLEVLRQLRANVATSALPVIMLTAKTRDEDVLRGYRCGAHYYITKPFSEQQLLYGLELVFGDPAGPRS